MYHLSPGANLADLVFRRVLAFGQDKGLDPRVALSAGGIDVDLPAVTGAIPPAHYERLAEAIFSLAPEPALALLAGAAEQPGQSHLPDYLRQRHGPMELITCQGLLFCELSLLSEDFNLAVRNRNALIRFRLDPRLPFFGRLLSEYVFASTLSLWRQLLNKPAAVDQLCFQHQAPTYLRHYVNILQAPVCFGKREYGMEFCRTVVPAQLIGQAVQPAATEPITAPASDTFEQQVASSIRYFMGQGRPLNAQLIANNLAISTSSLQRRLRARSLTYQDMLDRVRQEQCLDMLRNTDLSVRRIAAEVGFSDPGCLYRAWRRWTGTTLSRDALRHGPLVPDDEVK